MCFLVCIFYVTQFGSVSVLLVVVFQTLALSTLFVQYGMKLNEAREVFLSEESTVARLRQPVS